MGADLREWVRDKECRPAVVEVGRERELLGARMVEEKRSIVVVSWWS